MTVSLTFVNMLLLAAIHVKTESIFTNFRTREFLLFIF